MDMSLRQIAIEHGTDKAIPHEYADHYDRLFQWLRHMPVKLVEIGVASGASMRMWEEYFTHPDTLIYGIDIDPDCIYMPSDPRTSIILGDGARKNFGIGNVDIVIDDGSHTSDDIIAALNTWWPRLAPGGFYVVEDLAVQWRRDYGGSAAGSNATMMLGGYVSALMRGDQVGISEMYIAGELAIMRKSL